MGAGGKKHIVHFLALLNLQLQCSKSKATASAIYNDFRTGYIQYLAEVKNTIDSHRNVGNDN